MKTIRIISFLSLLTVAGVTLTAASSTFFSATAQPRVKFTTLINFNKSFILLKANAA